MTARRGAGFAVAAVAFVMPLWLVGYLPMVDLPQHAAQLSIWTHLHDAAWGFAATHQINYRTPYVLCYLVARPFVGLLGPAGALKVLISLVVVGLPASLWLLLASLDFDPWWALLGFPLAFGYSFYWGFLNFGVASCVGLVFLALAERYGRRPTARAGAAVALGAIALFVAHPLAFAICFPTALARPCFWRARLVARWPFVAPLPLVVLWYLTAARDTATHGPMVWELGSHRLSWMPALLLGHRGDRLAAVMGAVLVALPLLGFRARATVASWLPAAGIVLTLAVGPQLAFGTAFLYGRAAVFLVPFLFFALEPTPRGAWARPLRALVAVAVALWALLLCARFAAFDEEARGFATVEAAMKPGASVRSLIFANQSPAVPGVAVYLHLPLYYQADHGGANGFSFAASPFAFAHYRAGVGNRLPTDAEWTPQRFRWRREPRYDYYVVRAPDDLGPQLFAGAGATIRLAAHDGWWWLYAGPSDPTGD